MDKPDRITLVQAKAKRAQLEREIWGLITAFEDETDLQIETVDVRRLDTNTMGGKQSIVHTVEVGVKF